MPRQSKPWFWKARNAYYVQINGKQIRLSEDKKEADREFYRIMAAEGKLGPKQREQVTVADACEALIAASQHLRPNTLLAYQENLGALAGRFGGRRLDSIGPAEIVKWILTLTLKRNGQPLSDSSRSLQFAYVKLLCNWAKDTGLIDANQFARVKNPWKVAKRASPMREEDYEKVMSLPRVSPRFKEVVEFVWRTGIRPGELAILSARHLDARLAIARFQPSEHKTGTKTNLAREVFIPEDLWERLQRYAQIHKKGPLLRRKNGNPWTRRDITNTWGKLKVRHGLACCLYQARHRFATSLLDSGVPLARVAVMMGHTNPNVLLNTYYHPEAKQMAADVSADSKVESERNRRMNEACAKIQAELDETPGGHKRAADRERQQKRRAKLKSEASET